MEIVREFSGGLNLDDSIEVVPPGDWIDAFNVVDNSPYTDGNAIEIISGTTSIDISTWVDANSKNIGRVDVPKDDISYLFYYGTTKAHCILKLDAGAGTVSKVAQTTLLNFQNPGTYGKKYRVSGFVVAGPTGDLLYFTDNYNEARTIHTSRYTSSNPANEEEIFFIKRGPMYAPAVVSKTTTSGLSNSSEIYSDWIFAMQYVYFDNQVSVLSPYTSVVRRLSDADTYDTINLAYDGAGVTSLGGTSGNYNYDTVPNLVKEIKLFAKKGTTGTFIQVGNVTRATAGGSWSAAVFQPFYGAYTGEVLDPHYLQQFELIPQTIGEMTMAGDRGWIANYQDGYDKYDPANITLTSAAATNTNSYGSGIISFAPFTRIKFGFLLRDKNGRSGGVVHRPDFEVKISSDMASEYYNASLGGGSVPFYTKIRIQATLASLPSWVADAQLVVTKDLNKSAYWFFKLVPSGSAKYVDFEKSGADLGAAFALGAQRYIRIEPYEFPPNYAFQSGDRIIFYNSNASNLGTRYEFPILKVSGGYVYAQIPTPGMPETCPDPLCAMVYRPAGEATQNTYYEVGNYISSYGKSSVVPSAGSAVFDVTLAGDSIYDNLYPTGATYFWFPRMSYALDGQWVSFHGRPFIETRVDGVYKPTYVRYGGTYVSSSAVNYVSEFSTNSETNVSPNAGTVRRLQPTVRDSSQSAALLAICDTDTYSIYINESLLSSADANGIVVGSPKVIGDTRLNSSGFGTLHPESVCIDQNNHVYWYDHLARSYVRYSSNGIESISRLKMESYFYGQSTQNTKDSLVLSVYDPFYDMVYVWFNGYSSANQRCAGFHVGSMRWKGFFSFSADCFYSGSKKIYSMLNQYLYSHSTGSFGAVQGSTPNAYVKVSFNDGPADSKEWKVIQMQVSPDLYGFSGGDQVVLSNNLKCTFTNRHGQSTTLKYRASGEPEFDVDENMIYGPLKMDENSTGGIMNGEPMYSNTLQCKIEFSSVSGASHIRFVAMGCEVSRGHRL